MFRSRRPWPARRRLQVWCYRCTKRRLSVTMERPVLFAVAQVTLQISESSDAEPHTKGTGRMSKIRFIDFRGWPKTLSDFAFREARFLGHFGMSPDFGCRRSFSAMQYPSYAR